MEVNWVQAALVFISHTNPSVTQSLKILCGDSLISTCDICKRRTHDRDVKSHIFTQSAKIHATTCLDQVASSLVSSYQAIGLFVRYLIPEGRGSHCEIRRSVYR